MQFFKSLLASYGFGAAKIDLYLTSDYLTMGHKTKGKLVLKVGKTEQIIKSLYVDFHLRSRFFKKGRTVFTDTIESVDEVISHIPIRQKKFLVRPGQVVKFPFSFHCPDLLPVSSVSTQYELGTTLEIDSEIYSFDRDFVKVMPIGLIKNFMEGFALLDFVHSSEGYTGKQRDDKQMIQFQPTTWLRGEYKEIVFSYYPGASKNNISGFFELDKSSLNLDKRIVGKLADRKEKKGYYSFSATELATPEKAARTIRNFITQKSQNL